MVAPVFGFLTRPRQIIFPQHCDVLALQVAILRTVSFDEYVGVAGIASLTVNVNGPHTYNELPITQTIALNYNSGNLPINQAADAVLEGPSSPVAAYGALDITGGVVTNNWLWAQGPACQLGQVSGAEHGYAVRGYLFFNLTLLKQYAANLALTINLWGGSASTYYVWAEAMKAVRSVKFGTVNSLITLGACVPQIASAMPWTGKGNASAASAMVYYAKGVGTPGAGATDHLTPSVAINVPLAAETYVMTMSGSGFGGNSPNTFVVTKGAGED